MPKEWSVETDPQLTNEYPIIGMTPQEFVSDFSHRASQAQHAILFQCMFFTPGGYTNRFFDALTDAKRNNPNLNVACNIDGLQRLVTMFSTVSDTIHHRKGDSSLVEQSHRKLQEMKNMGVSVATSRALPLHHIPFFQKNRNHVRLAIVDDVAYFSNMNFVGDHGYGDDKDIIYRLNNPEIVENMKVLFYLHHGPERPTDYLLTTADGTRISIDTGHHATSLVIYNANEFIRTHVQKGDELMIATSWYPDGITPALREIYHKFGTPISHITFNPNFCPSLYELPFSLTKKASQLLTQRSGVPITSIYQPRKVLRASQDATNHAKNMLIVHADKTFHTFLTTSNLTAFGKIASATELSIETDQKTIGETLYQRNMSLIASYQRGGTDR